MRPGSKILSISEQCRILEIPRSSYYRTKDGKGKQRQKSFMSHLDDVMKEWLILSTYGYQKMARHLRRNGKDWATEYCLRMAYKWLGLKGQSAEFKCTRPSKHPYGKFPYLLRNRTIRYVNEVWATDITYIRLPDRMAYFTAIIDLKSRKILSWRLSESMEVGFCLDALQESLDTYGIPAIVNTDCGSQYTSKDFITMLQENNIQISMDGVGRCKDNIFVERTWRTLKYEWLFLRDYTTFDELEKSLGEFVEFFNTNRIHQGLDYRTPDEVYREGTFPVSIEEKEIEVA